MEKTLKELIDNLMWFDLVSKLKEILTNLQSTGAGKLQGYTIATLPSDAEVGDQAFVTDGTSGGIVAPVTTTGTVTRKVFYDGTVWTYQ